MTYTNIRVTCPDGERRHEGTFHSQREADEWAMWGHLCLAFGHTFSADTYNDEVQS